MSIKWLLDVPRSIISNLLLCSFRLYKDHFPHLALLPFIFICQTLLCWFHESVEIKMPSPDVKWKECMWAWSGKRRIMETTYRTCSYLWRHMHVCETRTPSLLLQPLQVCWCSHTERLQPCNENVMLSAACDPSTNQSNCSRSWRSTAQGGARRL